MITICNIFLNITVSICKNPQIMYFECCGLHESHKYAGKLMQQFTVIIVLHFVRKTTL